MLRSTLLPLALCAGLAAQQVTTTAYVQDSLRGTAGNMVPFGCLSNGLFAEGRTQILIPATMLPGSGARLVGIAVQSQTSSGGSGTLTYQILRITVSRSGGTLSPTFASNLPSPVIVFNQGFVPIHWTANQWTEIRFTTPYVHDDQSALVIDIAKIVTPSLDLGSRTIQNAGRSDLPRMINAFGTLGSGAWTAATATVTTNHAPSMRLLWEGAGRPIVPTLKLRSDDTTGSGNQFPRGGAIEHIVQASPGVPVVDLVGTGVNLRVTVSPLLAGRIWLRDLFTFGQGIVPASGTRTTTIPIPNQASVVGVHLAFQTLAFEAGGPKWPMTNVADCIINA